MKKDTTWLNLVFMEYKFWASTNNDIFPTKIPIYIYLD